MPEFVPRPQLPQGLAEQLLQLMSRPQTTPLTAVIQGLSGVAKGALEGLGEKRKKQEGIEKEKRELVGKKELRRIPLDEAIRQSATALGLNLPAEMKDIDEDIGKAIVGGAGGLARAKATTQGWLQRIQSAGTNRELLLDYRKQIMKDFTLDLGEQKGLIQQLDQLLGKKLIEPQQRKLGIKSAPATPQQVLPGLSVY